MKSVHSLRFSTIRVVSFTLDVAPPFACQVHEGTWALAKPKLNYNTGDPPGLVMFFGGPTEYRLKPIILKGNKSH